MDFQTISDRALVIRQKYHNFELKSVGHSWSILEIMGGFVGNVGELMKFIMAKEGSRKDLLDIDQKIKHVICDCLWCVLVLAKKYNINLETEFMTKMDDLDKRISAEL